MKNERKPYFRCQYQAGEFITSMVVEQEGYIPIGNMMICLCLLVRNVNEEVDKKTGGRVAMAVLNRFKDMVKNMEMDTNGTGGSKSYYLDSKSKFKVNRSERLDVEFYGNGGRDDGSNPNISKFLYYFKRMILDQKRSAIIKPSKKKKSKSLKSFKK